MAGAQTIERQVEATSLLLHVKLHKSLARQVPRLIWACLQEILLPPGQLVTQQPAFLPPASKLAAASIACVFRQRHRCLALVWLSLLAGMLTALPLSLLSIDGSGGWFALTGTTFSSGRQIVASSELIQALQLFNRTLAMQSAQLGLLSRTGKAPAITSHMFILL